MNKITQLEKEKRTCKYRVGSRESARSRGESRGTRDWKAEEGKAEERERERDRERERGSDEREAGGSLYKSAPLGPLNSIFFGFQLPVQLLMGQRRFMLENHEAGCGHRTQVSLSSRSSLNTVYENSDFTRVLGN